MAIFFAKIEKKVREFWARGTNTPWKKIPRKTSSRNSIPQEYGSRKKSSSRNITPEYLFLDAIGISAPRFGPKFLIISGKIYSYKY